MDSTHASTIGSPQRFEGRTLAAFPSRPTRANYGAPVRLQTNSYRIVNTNSSIKCIHKYSVHFEPEIPINSKVTSKVLREVRAKITADL